MIKILGQSVAIFLLICSLPHTIVGSYDIAIIFATLALLILLLSVKFANMMKKDIQEIKRKNK